MIYCENIVDVTSLICLLTRYNKIIPMSPKAWMVPLLKRSKQDDPSIESLRLLI